MQNSLLHVLNVLAVCVHNIMINIHPVLFLTRNPLKKIKKTAQIKEGKYGVPDVNSWDPQPKKLP